MLYQYMPSLFRSCQIYSDSTRMQHVPMNTLFIFLIIDLYHSVAHLAARVVAGRIAGTSVFEVPAAR